MNTANNQNAFDALDQLMKAHSAKSNQSMTPESEILYQQFIEGMELDSEKLLGALILRALKKKTNPHNTDENIYLKKYEIPQIQLFNILIDKFPFVKYSQNFTNSAIVDLIDEDAEGTIIDIGIGQGTQLMNIVGLLRSSRTLKKLHIVGIEPSEDALDIAIKSFSSIQNELPFELQFSPIHDFIENIDFSKIENITGTIIVNASLSLHHIQSSEKRTEIISKIKKIKPTAFILIEPNVNHFETDFYQRFRNCYNHFHGIFKVIDNLEIDPLDKNALKLFFGREIEDIIGKEEQDRFEKHEPAIQWIERLKHNRFSIAENLLKPTVDSIAGVDIKFHKEGFLGFTVQSETVLAVICAN
jgi:hypothetical protein